MRLLSKCTYTLLHALIENDQNETSMNINSSKLPLYVSIVAIICYTHP